MKPLIISVVRDQKMYEHCIACNPVCSSCETLVFDNRVKNERIPVLYNRALNGLDGKESRWLVFCHEDFKPLEPLNTWLKQADKKKIYGTIGGRLNPRRPWFFGGIWGGEFKGLIIESLKDGSSPQPRGKAVPLDTQVETVDCQCLIVHSSTIKKHQLQFDENLSFDLYTEDFCLGSHLLYGIETAILPIRCQHFSRGHLLPRFFEQKAYLDRKYPNAEAFTSVGFTIGGGRTTMRRFQKHVRTYLDHHAPSMVSLYFSIANYL